MEIKQYIYDLLFTQDCVILPKLGAFKTKAESAVINEATKTITPPRKRVIFDDKVTTSDENLLAQTISDSEGIGIDLALLEVEVFISDIQNKLLGGESVQLEGIGTLTPGAKGKITFKEEENSNFHPDAFGLKSIKFVGNASGTGKLAQTISTPKTSTKRSYKWLVWLIVLLVIGGLGFFAYKAGYVKYAKDYIAKYTKNQAVDTTGMNESTNELEENLAKSLKEESNMKKDDSINKKPVTVANEVNTTTSKTPVETKKEPEKAVKKVVSDESATAKFFIIESSYGDSINALKRSNELKTKGYNSQVMPKENNSFRVSMGAFSTRSTAIIELERIKSQDPKLKVWIFKK